MNAEQTCLLLSQLWQPLIENLPDGVARRAAATSRFYVFFDDFFFVNWLAESN